MPTEQTERLADLVASALECAVAERAQFLSDVCGDDVALREEAESLLRFEENARDFIETPAYDLAPEIIPNGASEGSPAPEPILQSKPIADFASELPSPEIERGDPEEVLNARSEESPASEPIFQSEANVDFGSELQSPEIEDGDHEEVLNEVTETASASEPIVQSEATGDFESELQGSEIERGDREEVLNAVSEAAPAAEQLSEIGTIADFASELQSPEVERPDREETVAAEIPEEPKQQSEPAPQPVEKTEGSFVIPPLSAREHAASRSARFVWAKRAAFIAVVLFAVAMVIALSSAFENAKIARRQRDVAQAEQSRAERINNFLQQILSVSDQNFTSVWPVAQKRNLTMSEMLDRIVPRVQKELADQPDVRGELLRRIGDAYAAQGDHNAAEKNLRAALQAQTTFYGEESGQVVETMVDLGALLYRREKFPEAERFLEKGVTFLRKQNQTEGGRSNAMKLAYALDQLGAVKFYRGDVKAGRAVLEEALRVATQAQPKERDRSVLTNIKTDLGGLLVLIGELRNRRNFVRRISGRVPRRDNCSAVGNRNDIANVGRAGPGQKSAT